MLNEYCKLRKKSFFLPLLLALLFLVVQLISTLVLHITLSRYIPAGYELRDGFPLLGGPLVLIAACLMLYCNGLLYFPLHLDLFLSLGRSRRNTLHPLLGYFGLQWGAVTGLTLALLLAERHLMPVIFRRLAGPELVLAPTPLPLWAVPLILLACCLGGLISATLVRRWGQRAGTALYFGFMACLLFFNHTDSFFYAALPVLTGLVVLFLLIGGLWSLREIGRTTVKF